MRKEIYLIRHGQTDNNYNKLWCGCSSVCNVNLNKDGVAEAICAAEKLQEKQINAIFSSDLQRAVSTAEIISGNLQIPHFVILDVQECDYGLADGLPISEVFEKWGDVANKFMNIEKSFFNVGFPGGESMNQALDRALPALRELVERETYPKVGVVMHAGVMSILLCYFGKRYPEIPNCSVALLVYDDNGFHIEGEIF